MKRLRDKPAYLHFYFFLVVAVMVLGIQLEGMWYASSITEAFLYAVGSGHLIVSGLCLGYTLVAPILLFSFQSFVFKWARN